VIPSSLTLRIQRLGPLPLINHVVRRVGLDELLAEFVPTTDRRQRISHAKALGVLLVFLVERSTTASRRWSAPSPRRRSGSI
jgi:hypothetical protein